MKINRKKQTLNSPIDPQELVRLQELTSYEKQARERGFSIIAGVDEAGRGPLAGPVVAASCILPNDYFLSGIDDSKKLSPKKRHHIYQILISDPQIIYQVAIVDSKVIDQINIYQATIKAMIESVDRLSTLPDYLLVDGLHLKHPNILGEGIIKGDQKSLSIAAASIIAKETRDELMLSYHEKWPGYGFDKHKGYGTQAHRNAIVKDGPCPIHRYTFEPIKSIF